jgi:hypothetical protein
MDELWTPGIWTDLQMLMDETWTRECKCKCERKIGHEGVVASKFEVEVRWARLSHWCDLRRFWRARPSVPPWPC